MWRRQEFSVITQRCYLRLPCLSDFQSWVTLRKDSEDFLAQWEPERDKNFYSLELFLLLGNKDHSALVMQFGVQEILFMMNQ